MKKYTAFAVALMLSLSLVACGSTEATTQESDDSQDQTEAATEVATTEEEAEPAAQDENAGEPAEVVRDLPEGDYEEVGEGTLELYNPSGSTADGDELVVYPDMESMPYAFMDYDLWDLDGSILTYVYLDGVQVDKAQVGAGYQSSIPLMEDWQIAPGEHVVEAVQYADSDPAGEIVFYRSQSFTVEEAL